MKIVITAANGYIGRVLAEYYAQKRYEVTAITRQPAYFGEGIKNQVWDGKHYDDSWAESLDGADAVINLAGKSVNCRYTEKNKKEIFDSRTFTTQAIAQAIEKCKVPPKLWINSASATIYRHAEDRPMDEYEGEIGTGFSVEVCKKWESAFFDSHTPFTRKIALRMAISLGYSDGVFLRLRNLVRFGLGGKQGNGKQMFSWIHDRDLCEAISFLIKNERLEGIINVSSPNPVDNEKIMRAIRNAMHIRIGLPAPVWLLKIGAILIGTETELILKSRWAVPKRLLDAGFEFQFPDIDKAVQNIVKKL